MRAMLDASRSCDDRRSSAARRPRAQARSAAGALVIAARVLLLVADPRLWELLSRTRRSSTRSSSDGRRISTRQLWTWRRTGPRTAPLWQQVWVTLKEALLGFVIGVFVGVIVRRRARAESAFLADVLRALHQGHQLDPTRRARLDLRRSRSGSALTSKVALAVVLVFFVVFFNAFQGVREVDRA